MNTPDTAQEIIRMLEQNYAGYQDKYSKYQTEILNARMQLLESSNEPVELDQAIRTYLAAFHEGHIRLDSQYTRQHSAAQPNMSYSPRLKLSNDWIWLTIPSFDDRWRDKIKDLLAEHQAEIIDGRTLVIDLRENSGGSDESYSALLPFVMSGAFQITGMQVLSTPDNIKAWEALPHQFPDMSDETKAQVHSLTENMSAHPKQFVNMGDSLSYTIPPEEFGGVQKNPSKVIVIQSKKTASSAEQFLLAAKQSHKVVRIGENSAGVLDYANMRQFDLASGHRTLWLGTTRSLRVSQGLGIDEIGIVPDIKLDHDTLFNDDVLEMAIRSHIAKKL
ncbi:S41 family peptidase [Chitinibacter sp. SCUT-21]|uniref:S41 family peptidase n=1 Tax=Chitinibacter sp. SCUT-21 TaxID=2970891 RepID=UPI0035A6408E